MLNRYTFILQAYGHFQEAAVHLRHALELKPDLSDAADALKEVESLPLASMHVYTLLIIVGLVRKLMKQIYKLSILYGYQQLNNILCLIFFASVF